MLMTRLKIAIMVLFAMSVVGLGGVISLHLMAGEPVRLEQTRNQPKPKKFEEPENRAVPKKEDGEPKSRSIPLNSIWALRMPGTRPLDITTTAGGKYLTPEGNLVGEIRGALRFDPENRPLGKEGLAVVGTEMDAVKDAHAVLVKGQKQKTVFQPDDKISLVFFSYQFGSYVHVKKVTQQGHKINVMYEFVPHETKEVTEHLAIIPIHHPGPGNVHVTLTPSFDKLKVFGLDPKEYEKKWVQLIVSRPYSFEIREKISDAQAGDMTDEQMLKRAVDVIAKEDANAKVTPVQSKNPHLGPWVLKTPLPDYSFFCARLDIGKEKAAPNRRFLAVKRTGQVIDGLDSNKFMQLLAVEDKAKWKDEDYRNAAILWVHVMSRANEDGWTVLAKPDDFTKITFNMDSVGQGGAKQKEAAKQIIPLKIERKDGQAVITFYAWHLIGGNLRRWQVEIGPRMAATKQELGQFGGGGYD